MGRIGRILNVTLTAFLAVALGCNLYTIIARQYFGQVQPTVLGWSAAVVISGSMSDTIEVNDLIIAKAQESYEKDDIISFLHGSSLVTHRIVEVQEDGYITKGDANNTPDPEPVSREKVVGKVVRVFPGVGAVIEAARSPLGMCCIVLLGLGLMALPTVLNAPQGGKYKK